MAGKWTLEWKHGRLDVHSTGGMLGGVLLRVEDRWLKPFYEAPWLGSAENVAPALLRHMRSEFVCVPFGAPHPGTRMAPIWRRLFSGDPAAQDIGLDPSDALLHGYGAVAEWDLVRQRDAEICIGVDYPPASAIRRLERTIRCDPESACIKFALEIYARRSTRRPVGLHPNFALPEAPGQFHILPGAFRVGIVHPAGPEPGVSHGVPGARFSNLERVPVTDGSADFTRLPFPHPTEEIVQLCGAGGLVVLVDAAAGVRYQLSWDAEQLPSLLLWMSNRGRAYPPWNGRNLCIGVEPVASAFELGCQASVMTNPINQLGVDTALQVDPARTLRIEYCIAAQSDEGPGERVRPRSRQT